MGHNWAGLKPNAYLPNDLYFWLQFVTGPHGKGFKLDPKVRLLESTRSTPFGSTVKNAPSQSMMVMSKGLQQKQPFSQKPQQQSSAARLNQGAVGGHFFG